MADIKSSASTYINTDGKVSSLVSSFPLAYALPNVTVKLREKNYAYWKSQMLPALKAYELEGFVICDKPCPLALIISPDDDSGKIINA